MKARFLIFLGSIGIGVAWLAIWGLNTLTSSLAEETSKIESAGVPNEVLESVQVFSQEFINLVKPISIVFLLVGLVVATISFYFAFKVIKKEWKENIDTYKKIII